MASLSANIVPYCRSIGLQDKSLAGGAEGYEGTHRGRKIALICGARSKTRYAGEIRIRSYDGHRLSISGSTTLKTRMVLGAATRGGAVVSLINRRLGIEKVESLAPTLEHLVSWASEPAWARSVVQDQEVNNMLSYLLPNEGAQANARFSLGPESFEFHLNTRAFSPEQVRYWVEAVLRLIEALEGGVAPLKVAELTKTESKIQDDPWLVLGLLAGGFILVGLLLSGALIAVLLVISQLG